MAFVYAAVFAEQIKIPQSILLKRITPACTRSTDFE